MVGDCEGGGLCLVEVTGIDHHHVRQHLHHPDIFKGLVSRSVLPEGDPGMGGTNLNVFI